MHNKSHGAAIISIPIYLILILLCVVAYNRYNEYWIKSASYFFSIFGIIGIGISGTAIMDER